jgi:hypothetical protein
MEEKEKKKIIIKQDRWTRTKYLLAVSTENGSRSFSYATKFFFPIDCCSHMATQFPGSCHM